MYVMVLIFQCFNTLGKQNQKVVIIWPKGMKENVTDEPGNCDSATIFVRGVGAMPIVKLYSRNDNDKTKLNKANNAE